MGTLSYDRWFSLKAKIALPEGKIFTIESSGFWVKTFEIKDNGNTLLTFKRRWNGDILIQTYFGSEKDFVFKRKGTVKGSFVLLDKENTELVALRPGLNWSKISYEYQIAAADSVGSSTNDIVLLLVAVHCANFAMAAMNGIIAGAA